MRKKTIIVINNLSNNNEVFDKYKDDVLTYSNKKSPTSISGGSVSLYRIAKKIPSMMNEKFGVRKASAIVRLGYSLIENFYLKFNMDGNKTNGVFYFAVYSDE